MSYTLETRIRYCTDHIGPDRSKCTDDCLRIVRDLTATGEDYDAALDGLADQVPPGWQMLFILRAS